MAKIAAQMYTLREYCKTPADIAASCARVKKMGYDGVQLSGIGPIDPKEMKRILDGEGLLCAATHISLEEMEGSPEAVIERQLLWGCPLTAIGGNFSKEPCRRSTWEEFVARYNALSKRYAGSGVRIGYHNHHLEFLQAGGIRPIDYLIANLNPDIWMEIDTHWVARGGADPAAYIEKVAHRIPLVHFKDIQLNPDKATYTMCEIGDGALNWPRIIQACRYAGVQWYAVERDSGEMDPFDSLQRSIDNMRSRMGL